MCKLAYYQLLIIFLLFLQHDLEGECSDNDSETTYIFECDFPECNSVCETSLYFLKYKIFSINAAFPFLIPVFFNLCFLLAEIHFSSSIERPY